jgi:hypothetical protein
MSNLQLRFWKPIRGERTFLDTKPWAWPHLVVMWPFGFQKDGILPEQFPKTGFGMHREGFQKPNCGAVPIGEATEKQMNLVDFPQTVIGREV